jgi:transposase
VRRDPTSCGLARSRWRLADLRQVLPFLADYSLPGIWQALRRLGIRLHRGRLRVQRPDPASAEKVFRLARLQRLAQRFPARVTLVYADEMSLYRQPTLASVYAPVGTEPTASLSHRSTTVRRYAGALNAVTGQLTWHSASRMSVPELCRFLDHVRQAYPQRVLFLAWDNWPIHRHAQVLATAARLKIHLVWLPTYAPWTNPIEKLWRWLRQTVVHHHRLADQWTALQDRVATFFNQFASGSPEVLRSVGLLTD